MSCNCNGYSKSCDVDMLPNYECKCDEMSMTTGSLVCLLQINNYPEKIIYLLLKYLISAINVYLCIITKNMCLDLIILHQFAAFVNVIIGLTLVYMISV